MTAMTDPARDLITGTEASAAVFAPWTDDENAMFKSFVEVMHQTAGPLTAMPDTFDKLLDLLSRAPVLDERPDGSSEVVVTNQLIMDPEDPKLHLVVFGRKVYRLCQ